VLAYTEQGITGRNNKQEIDNLAFSCCPLFLLGLACYGSKMVAEKESLLKSSPNEKNRSERDSAQAYRLIKKIIGLTLSS
jgi:hypothetical protein